MSSTKPTRPADLLTEAGAMGQTNPLTAALAKRLGAQALAPRIAQKAVELMLDLGATDADAFAMFLAAALAVARHSDTPDEFALQFEAAAVIARKGKPEGTDNGY